jgi:putative sporulation protein YyaC
MLITQAHYSDQGAVEQIYQGLDRALNLGDKEPLFLCIGSDRHILDCFAPLIGTMLTEKLPQICLYGTLDKPLHAKNMVKQLQEIQTLHANRFEIAIDASLGASTDIGYIKIKDDSLLPGKAFAKSLPPIGQLSIIGIVGTRTDRYTASALNNGSLAHVYHMAVILTEAITQWIRSRS